MTEHKHSAERNCNTCRHHVQGCSLNDVPARCWDCTGYGKAYPDDSGMSPVWELPMWQPIEIKKETPMSGGMEEMSRWEAEEAAEAEMDAMRAAVAPRRILLVPKVTPLATVAADPLKTQVGGDHYKEFKIQPLEFAIANKLDFFQKDILKYICRRKGDKVKRVEDLKKASHYIELYVQAIEKGDIE